MSRYQELMDSLPILASAALRELGKIQNVCADDRAMFALPRACGDDQLAALLEWADDLEHRVGLDVTRFRPAVEAFVKAVQAARIFAEFPEYDDALPLLLPPFFADPWHNDTCPKYSVRLGDSDEEAQADLWCEWAEPSAREYGAEWPRFILSVTDVKGYCVAWQLEGETIADLERVARQYAAHHALPLDERAPLGEVLKACAQHALATTEDRL